MDAGHQPPIGLRRTRRTCHPATDPGLGPGDARIDPVTVRWKLASRTIRSAYL
jgi:hypothetical protein